MEDKESLSFADIKEAIGEHLRTALNIKGEFSITFAKLEGNYWKVNVEYTEELVLVPWLQSAMFKIDAKSGAVVEFEKGKYWST